MLDLLLQVPRLACAVSSGRLTAVKPSFIHVSLTARTCTKFNILLHNILQMRVLLVFYFTLVVLYYFNVAALDGI